MCFLEYFPPPLVSTWSYSTLISSSFSVCFFFTLEPSLTISLELQTWADSRTSVRGELKESVCEWWNQTHSHTLQTNQLTLIYNLQYRPAAVLAALAAVLIVKRETNSCHIQRFCFTPVQTGLEVNNISSVVMWRVCITAVSTCTHLKHRSDAELKRSSQTLWISIGRVCRGCLSHSRREKERLFFLIGLITEGVGAH